MSIYDGGFWIVYLLAAWVFIRWCYRQDERIDKQREKNMNELRDWNTKVMAERTAQLDELKAMNESFGRKETRRHEVPDITIVDMHSGSGIEALKASVDEVLDADPNAEIRFANLEDIPPDHPVQEMIKEVKDHVEGRRYRHKIEQDFVTHDYTMAVVHAVAMFKAVPNEHNAELLHSLRNLCTEYNKMDDDAREVARGVSDSVIKRLLGGEQE